MAKLGRKFTCYSCHTKYYDLGKETPVCPKCGADARELDEAPAPSHRRAKAAPVAVVEEPIEEEFVEEEVSDVVEAEEEAEIIGEIEPQEVEVEEEDDDEEEEEY